jgi:integrase
MALEIRKTSQWWYGRWMTDGKRHCARLKVKVAGHPGEAEFEESRKVAQDALDKVIAKHAEQKRPEDLVQEIHRVKFGHRIGSIPLLHLFEAWKKIPRKRQPKERYLDWAEGTFKRLIQFVRKEYPLVKEMAGVDKRIAEAFMRAEEKRKVSPKTYNAELILLRGAFEHLREDAGMLSNPFGRIVTKDAETIHRKPFTAEELKAILDAVQEDRLMRPLILVGVCTAMRRGDACLLKWEAVDLVNDYITVKTSKTGETVDIPILALLREELASLRRRKSGYVFPELAAMYLKNPDGVNWRLNQIFEKAGVIDEVEIKRRNEKREKAGLPALAIKRRDDKHVEREGGIGLRQANVRGFHSLRVTWITIALAAGVPMELVRRVTGHKTADVVLKNYFKPGRAEFAKAITGAMPALLTQGAEKKAEGGKVKPETELKKALAAIAERLSAQTWMQAQTELRALVRGM